MEIQRSISVNVNRSQSTSKLVSVVILTYNEEIHLERAIRSVSSLADDIVVVDSYSTDSTVRIAEACGARIFQNPFINQAKQFAWALENTQLSTPWIMRLDADEFIDSELAERIRAVAEECPPEISGLYLRRKHVFMGRWIRFGDRYPLDLLRVWRAGQGQMEDRWMDEHIVLKSGKAILVEGGFYDDNLNSIGWFISKHNAYASREAIEFLIGKYNLRDRKEFQSSFGNRVKRIIKYSVYYRMPFWMSATLYFIYRFGLRLGFLDGVEGVIYHFLQGYWYRFLVGAKACEFERLLKRNGQTIGIETLESLLKL